MEHEIVPGRNTDLPDRGQLRTRAVDLAPPGEWGPLQELQRDGGALSVERLQQERLNDHYSYLQLLSPCPFFLLGLDGVILFANLAAQDMLGLDLGQSARCHFVSFVRTSFRLDFDRMIQDALNSSQARTCRMRLRRKQDTGTQDVDVTVHAAADPSGQAVRLHVEPAAGLQAALEHSETRLRRLVHSAVEGMCELDLQGRITFANPALERLLRWPLRELLGASLEELIDDASLPLAAAPATAELRLRRKDGRRIWVRVHSTPLPSSNGALGGTALLVTDLVPQPATTESLWRESTFDPVTQLPNRHALLDRLTCDLALTRRLRGTLALLCLELDRFPQLIEHYGEEVVNAVLNESARRIRKVVRGTDAVAHVQEDGFAIVLAGLSGQQALDRVCDQLIAVFAEPFGVPGHSVPTSASIGVAMHPLDGDDPVRLLQHAERAVRVAKAEGGGRYAFCGSIQQQAAQARQELIRELRIALDEHQFELLYQPIIELRTGRVCKAEALLRWRHPQRGLLGPASFLPQIEYSDLARAIGDWVFHEAVQQARAWQQSLDESFQVSINKSPAQLQRVEDDGQDWRVVLNGSQLTGHSIVIEVTEPLLARSSRVRTQLEQCRAIGMQVSLDDFGSAQTPFVRLARGDIDFVKIDPSYVSTMEEDQASRALCEALVAMAHKMGMQVVAEGVESDSQRAMLAQADCDYAQGYLFAPPMPARELEQLARTGSVGTALH
jgi:diguanylate cyclase (GGDEF)-like protein/PAS domain S-box-containing protein